MACLFDNTNENSRASVQITVKLIVISSLLYLQHTVVSTIWSEGCLNTLWFHVEGSQLNLSLLNYWSRESKQRSEARFVFFKYPEHSTWSQQSNEHYFEDELSELRWSCCFISIKQMAVTMTTKAVPCVCVCVWGHRKPMKGLDARTGTLWSWRGLWMLIFAPIN